MSNGDTQPKVLRPGSDESLRCVVECPGWGSLSQVVVELKPVITKDEG